MEKFFNIAESITNLKAYEGYQLVRLDVIYNKDKAAFMAYASYEKDDINDLEIRINNDGSFSTTTCYPH